MRSHVKGGADLSVPLGDLETLIAAAGRTRFYKAWLAGGGRSAEDLLREAPVVGLGDVYEHRDAFRNGTVMPAPAAFRYPLQPAPRCVVLATGFRAAHDVCVLADVRQLDVRGLADSAALAAPVEVLRGLAAEHACEFRYPMVAFTGPCYGLLSDSDRQAIWSAFRVPVYEQFLGIRNELLAEECGAHDGLHVLEHRVWFDCEGEELLITSFANLAYPVLRLASGLCGRTQPSACACGRRGLKLINLRAMRWPLAATA
jgi:hypothetical protein